MNPEILFAIAWKSVLLSALVLLLMTVFAKRSAAERSSIAHAGLAALLLLPVLVLTAPRWELAWLAPAELAPMATAAAQADEKLAAMAAPTTLTTGPALTAGSQRMSEPAVTIEPVVFPATAEVPWPFLYVLPALLLIGLLGLALLRLDALRSNSERVLDQHWLTALERARVRMGCTREIELRATDALTSPLSWGLLRPIIVLDSSVTSTRPDPTQAEALLAHELAHVLRSDWCKLLLARLVCALFWFNPLVWLLGRASHQLREEAADDAVLRQRVVNTDYAQLLVSAARRQRTSVLLAAHAMAPAPGALRQRVVRVLDAGLRRAPALRSWTFGCAAGALALALPLAALTPISQPLQQLAPLTPLAAEPVVAGTPRNADEISWMLHAVKGKPGEVQLSLSFSDGHGESNTSRSIALSELQGLSAAQLAVSASAPVRFRLVREAGVLECEGSARDQRGAGDCRFQPDSAFAAELERRQIGRPTPYEQLELAIQGVGLALVNELARQGYERPRIEQLVECGIHGVSASWLNELDQAGYRMKSIARLVEFRIHGVSPTYIRELAALGYMNLPAARLVEFRIHGVTAGAVGELAALGYHNLAPERLVEFRIHGVTPEYVGDMAKLGYTGIDEERLVEFRIHGVTPEYVGELKQLGYRDIAPEKLVEMRIHGVSPQFIRERQKDSTRPSVDELVEMRIHGR